MVAENVEHITKNGIENKTDTNIMDEHKATIQKFKVPDPVVKVNGVNLYYGTNQALKNICIDISKNKTTAFIGPSGCGKSTLLRCFNRLNDLVDSARVEGEILIDGDDIYDPSVDITELRKRVGMFLQKSNPFPKSIYENVAYGARISG